MINPSAIQAKRKFNALLENPAAWSNLIPSKQM
jgi:hypothetical protein